MKTIGKFYIFNREGLNQIKKKYFRIYLIFLTLISFDFEDFWFSFKRSMVQNWNDILVSLDFLNHQYYTPSGQKNRKKVYETKVGWMINIMRNFVVLETNFLLLSFLTIKIGWFLPIFLNILIFVFYTVMIIISIYKRNDLQYSYENDREYRSYY